jgi:hypothetical protein
VIKPEMIPDEVVEAAARAIAIANEGHDKWWTLHMRKASEAIAAALNAWTGMDLKGYGPPFYGIEIILPLAKTGESNER